MAASVETQRLISMSLGKIAQSRGQRGGINLHKNLLVATVLNKARTAYMMETYNYHQQQSMLRQKQQHELVQHEQQKLEIQIDLQASDKVCNVESNNERGPDIEVCQTSRDSDLGHTDLTPTPRGEEGSEATRAVTTDHEAMAVQEIENIDVLDKENSPPVNSAAPNSSVPDCVDSFQEKESSNSDHLTAATQLSHEAQLASSFSMDLSCQKQQTLTTGSTTCTGILKRRRDNPSVSLFDTDCPANKKVKVSHDSSLVPSRVSNVNICHQPFGSLSDSSSSDESDYESDVEVISMQTSDSPQISNLVNIFNSGFSGLCAQPRDSCLDNGYQKSDHDISSSQSQFTTLSSVVPFSRKMSEPALLCSSEVGRLDSLPSAIVLSA